MGSGRQLASWTVVHPNGWQGWWSDRCLTSLPVQEAAGVKEKDMAWRHGRVEGHLTEWESSLKRATSLSPKQRIFSLSLIFEHTTHHE